jgi:tetratricopeptide (TPR) repeat protein
VLRRQGEIESSLASYHRALSFQPHYPRVQLAVADIYRQQHRYARELATLRTLADGYAADELPAQVLYQQGVALKKLRRYDAAIESLAAAESGIRPQSDVLFHLAEAQWLAGDPVNARLTVSRSLALDPNHASSLALHTQLVAAQPQAMGTIRR